MSDRITVKNLRSMIDHLNKQTGNADTPWTRKDGRAFSNIGNYHLSETYGGFSLHQMVNKGGGVNDVFGCGYTTKRDLYNRIRAYMIGLEN